MNLEGRGAEIMDCKAVQERLALDALDLLESDAERRALRQHLESGCPACSAEQAAVRETLGLLPYARTPEEPSPMVKARLVAAVRRDAANSAAEPRGFGRSRLWAVGIAAGVIVAVLTGVLVSRRERVLVADLHSRLRAQERELALLKQQMIRARDTLQLVSSPGVSVIDLEGQADRSESRARVFWDRRRQTWQIFAGGLPPPAKGRSYQLWMVTATAKINAGVFDPAATAEASGTVAIPRDAGAVVAAAVTEEPEGGSPQPTGAILLLGKI
ncbi:MAG TPA: anti-sigma factor [Candidatus Polarisedimenticolia bacterium]|jgi:anti-sigma-K factor RskA|nr:anti-sigma factor [Candidatus Polarisedimenticolia bacterium]